MRFFRFVGLVTTVVVAYAALLLLTPHILTTLPSAGSFAALAAFYPLLNELIPYTGLLVSLATITFGVLTAPWPLSPTRLTTGDERRQSGRGQARYWLGGILLLLALLATSGALWHRWQQGQEDLTIHLLWAGGILGYLLACGRLGGVRIKATTAAKRARHWPVIGLLLLGALFYLGWRFMTMPMQLEEPVVAAARQALTLATSATPQLFVPQTPAAPTAGPTPLAAYSATLALVPTALLTWLDGDLLRSMRLIGLGSALLFGWSVWLVSRELFRRPVRILTEVTFVDGRGIVIHPLEDDGASLALVATLLVLTNSATLLFSRHPFLLASAAAGTLGCWALLRAWSTHDRLALGVSGSLLGFAVASHLSSWSFVGAALCWWLGMVVANRAWLPQRAGRGALLPFHFGDFLLWLAGLMVVVAPFWLGLFISGLPIGTLFTANLTQQLTAMGRDLLSGTALGSGTFSLFHPWLIPLLVLALGSLLFNLDRKQGWLLLSWSATACLWAGAVALEQTERAQHGVAMLLPLIPPLAAALAFGLDRLRITLLRAGGGWLHQFWHYGLLGLLLWVTFQNGVAYYITALDQSEPISALGQTLRTLDHAQPIIVIDPTQQLASPGALAQLEVLTTGARVGFADVIVVPQLPPQLAQGSMVIFFANDSALLPALRAQYPQGTRTTVRANNANLLLYLYQLP